MSSSSTHELDTMPQSESSTVHIPSSSTTDLPASNTLSTEPSTVFNTPRASTSLSNLVDAYKAREEGKKLSGEGVEWLVDPPSAVKEHDAPSSLSRLDLPSSPRSQDTITIHKREESGATTQPEDSEQYIVKVEGDKDPLDAHNLPFAWKFLACFSVAFNALIVSSFGSAYLFITPDLEQAFGASQTVVTTGFVVYVIGWGPGPLIWAPLAESIGRKPVYIGSSLAWTCFNIGCARAQSVSTMIVCRFFAGFFGCACLTNGGGTNTDIFAGLAIARSIALYSAVVFLGPVLGPIIGGAIQTYAPSVGSLEGDTAGWRWLFYAAIISGAFSTLLYVISPETLINKRLQRRVKERRQRDPLHAPLYGTEADKHGMSTVAKMASVAGGAINMLRSEPIIVFVSLWQTTVMAIIYLFFDAFPVVFGLGHGFNAFQTGLTFIGCGVGMLAACLWSLTVDLHLWIRRLKRANMERQPEMRLPQGLMGAFLTVIGLFWFGYTSFPSIHWMVPIVGSAVYSFGALSVMLSTFAYVVDTYLARSSPAFAAIGLIRSVAIGVFPLFGAQFYLNLKPRNATLILALVAVVEIAIPLGAMKWGQRLRNKSHYAMKTT